MFCSKFSFQFAFTIKDTEEGEAMIALMQEDTRKSKEEGKENLTIGFFVMKVNENFFAVNF